MRPRVDQPVVHYFPNASYLHDVVSAAVASSPRPPTAVVVVGDVRARDCSALPPRCAGIPQPGGLRRRRRRLADAAALSETQLCVHPRSSSSPPSTAFACCRSAAPPPTSSRSTGTMSSFTSAARAPPSRRRRRRAMSSWEADGGEGCARASPMRSAPAAAPSCAACQTAACSSTAVRPVPTRGRWRRQRLLPPGGAALELAFSRDDATTLDVFIAPGATAGEGRRARRRRRCTRVPLCRSPRRRTTFNRGGGARASRRRRVARRRAVGRDRAERPCGARAR